MSAPPLAWVFNLDAELELSKPRYSTPLRLQALLDQHGASSRQLMGPNDVLAQPAPADASSRLGRAWCPTPAAIEILVAAGVPPEPHPAVDVLRRVNHRRFACELGGGLPHQRYLETRDELDSALAAPPPKWARGWLLKRPLTFAGRGQLRLEGARPRDEKQQLWVDASFRQDGLVLEPLVAPRLELSLHGFIQTDGSWTLGFPCVQEVSPRGAFQGVARADEPGVLSEEEARQLREQGERVAHRLAAEGYFGPFGIDAYRHDAGFCALSEINARYTLGFAVGFPEPAHALRLNPRPRSSPLTRECEG